MDDPAGLVADPDAAVGDPDAAVEHADAAMAKGGAAVEHACARHAVADGSKCGADKFDGGW
jgi:hypothetical protein